MAGGKRGHSRCQCQRCVVGTVAPADHDRVSIHRALVREAAAEHEHAILVDRAAAQDHSIRSHIVDEQIERGRDDSATMIVGCDRDPLRLVRAIISIKRPGPCSVVAGVLSDRADGRCNSWTIREVDIGKAS